VGQLRDEVHSDLSSQYCKQGQNELEKNKLQTLEIDALNLNHY
jgi:hypothetical protein